MEDITKKEINFLPKPTIDPKKLNYVIGSKKVYANLYEIFLSKTIIFYQYHFKVVPEIEPGDAGIRKIISGAAYKSLKDIYGEFRILGDSLYCTKKVEELNNVKAVKKEKKRGREEFTLIFEKYKLERTIKQEDIGKDEPLIKQFLEIIVKDILHSNPKLDFEKNIFFLKSDKKNIEQDDTSVTFSPGFQTSFMETDNGHFLNVTLKNKIVQNYTILEYLDYYYNGYKNNRNKQKEINDEKKGLKGRLFKTSYSSKTYQIEEFNFELSPSNKTINYEGKSRTLVEFHKLKHAKIVKDLNQPLIKVTQKNGKELFFVPELCTLLGLEESDTKNKPFMKQLAKYTKLEPNERVVKTSEFIKLLDDDSTDEDHPISAKKKKELYGIEIKPTSNLFEAYYMEETKLIGGKIKSKNKQIKSRYRIFPVLEIVYMTKWVCIYEKNFMMMLINLIKL